MPTGKVKFFSEQKGWGYIKEDGTLREVFVHYSSIIAEGFKTLAEADRVEFDVEKTAKGNKAVNVRRIV